MALLSILLALRGTTKRITKIQKDVEECEADQARNKSEASLYREDLSKATGFLRVAGAALSISLTGFSVPYNPSAPSLLANTDSVT